MNLAAFAVVVARERATPYGDDLRALNGLGAERPWLAWPMTIAMLSLAGFPATAGFFGKIYLIEAAVDNDYAFLGVVIVLGSAISLAYYLRVVAAVWLRPPDESPAPGRVVSRRRARPAIAGGSQEADDVLERPRSGSGAVRDRSRRGRLRGRDDRARDLPRAAVQRRPRRRRVADEPAVAAARRCPRAIPAGGAVRAAMVRGRRGRGFPAAAYGVGCASPTPHRRSGLRRIRRAPRSGVRRRRGGRGGGVGAADRRAGRGCDPAWHLPRRRRGLHAAGGARGRARAVPRAGAVGPGAAGRSRAGGEDRARRLAARAAPLRRQRVGVVRRRRGGRRQRRARDGGAGARREACAAAPGCSSRSGRTWEFPNFAAAVALRAPLGAYGDADRRGARVVAGRRSPAAARRRLQGGRRLPRVRRRARHPAGRPRLGRGGARRRRGPAHRARRARDLLRPGRRRDGRQARARARLAAAPRCRPGRARDHDRARPRGRAPRQRRRARALRARAARPGGLARRPRHPAARGHAAALRPRPAARGRAGARPHRSRPTAPRCAA